MQNKTLTIEINFKVQVVRAKIALLTFFLFYKYSYCQNITFQKTYGSVNYEEMRDAQQTSDSGYIIAGYSGPLTNFDAYLIKTNRNGDTLWTKLYKGAGLDLFYAVQQTNDNGYILAGRTSSFGSGGLDVCLVKTNSAGDTLWTKTYGGVNDETANSIRQTADGGYIIAGNTYSYGAGANDFYLIKINSAGNIIWSRVLGGPGNDNAYCVRQTADGGYIVAGLTNSFGAGSNDIYLIKTNANGDTLWTKTYGGINDDRANSVQQTNDGGYIIGGVTRSFGAGNYDCYLIKTDSSGSILWSKTYGGAANDWAFSVRQTNAGNYILAGYTSSFGMGGDDYYLIKVNINGDTLWTRTYGGVSSDYPTAVQQTADNGFIVAGYSQSFGAGSYDCYLIKTDSLGNTNCNQSITNTIVTSPLTLTSNSAGQIIMGAITSNAPAIAGGSLTILNTLCSNVSINEQHAFETSSLYQNTPNPFGDETTINYYLPYSCGETKMLFMDEYGNTIKEMENLPAGNGSVHIDSKMLSSGIYSYSLIVGGKVVDTKKMVRAK